MSLCIGAQSCPGQTLSVWNPGNRMMSQTETHLDFLLPNTKNKTSQELLRYNLSSPHTALFCYPAFHIQQAYVIMFNMCLCMCMHVYISNSQNNFSSVGQNLKDLKDKWSDTSLNTIGSCMEMHSHCPPRSKNSLTSSSLAIKDPNIGEKFGTCPSSLLH